MAMTDSALGSKDLDLGPCNIYLGSGINEMDMGGVQSFTLEFGDEKTDLTYAQHGTSPANKVVTATYCRFNFDMVAGTLERLAKVFPGTELVKNTNGDLISFSFSSNVGVRDSDVWAPARIVRTFGDAESTRPEDQVLFFRCAPTAQGSLSFDASTQRSINVAFECYTDTTHLDTRGRPKFFEIVGTT